MNNDRRKALRSIAEQISVLAGKFEDLKEEEQEYLDNMHENLHGSDRYQTGDNAVNAMDTAIDMFPEFDEITNAIEEACE